MSKKETYQKAEVCAYKECCYLAEALECFGYKTDCVLYIKSNNRFYSRRSFDEAINKLIDKTRVKFDLLETGDKSVGSGKGK